MFNLDGVPAFESVEIMSPMSLQPPVQAIPKSQQPDKLEHFGTQWKR